MDKFDVRLATEKDKPAIRDLNTRAFGRADEAGIIGKLEEEGAVILQLVADAEGQIIGHALFYHVGVFGKLGAVGLGPMSVDPWVQREGIGTAMVNLGLSHVKNSGGSMVFVLGHPEYYPRFGFSEAAAADFQAPWKGPHFMGLRLRYGPPMSGRLIFPDAFDAPEVPA